MALPQGRLLTHAHALADLRGRHVEAVQAREDAVRAEVLERGVDGGALIAERGMDWIEETDRARRWLWRLDEGTGVDSTSTAVVAARSFVLGRVGDGGTTIVIASVE